MRERFDCREQTFASWRESRYEPDGSLTRRAVYNNIEAIRIAGTPTSETRRQADRLCDRKIKQSRFYKSSKEQQKRTFSMS